MEPMRTLDSEISSSTPVIKGGIKAVAVLCHAQSLKSGFWPDGAERNKGEQIALMHSELSEMLEGTRKPGPDSHCPEFTSEEIELADLLIRAFDYAVGHQLRLTDALLAKMRYNATRPFKHGKEF